MSVKQHVNDDEKEIHELPEIATLPEGMMVAVDSERTGTKSFNLTAALEEKASTEDVEAIETDMEGKVDSPSTTPTAGQVLMFDGTDNVWSDPPEGVYVLNYTEVSDLNDIDINRVKTQPTFMKVDTDITVTIPTSGSPYTVSVQQGTLMAIDEIGSEGTTGSYTGPRFISFYCNNGKSVGGGIMQNADLKILCMVSLSPFGGVTKTWGANGFLNNDGALLRTVPAPVTFKCTNSRGPGEVSVTTNHALKVEIQSLGQIRTQSLLPAEIETHDFSTDDEPEQIQFMGWGATSNRAGYKELITAKSNIEDDQIPLQTPTVSITKMNIGNQASLEEDQVVPLITTTVKDTSGTSSTIDGYLIPRIPSIQGEKVYLQYYWEGQKGHLDWAKIDVMSDLVLVTGETGAEKAANCQAIIDAGKLPIYNAALKADGVPYNQVLVYQCSDDNNFYFMGCYPTYFVNGTFKFRADTNDIQIGLWHFDKTSFSNGYTIRTIDDLLVNSSPISSTTSSATIPNNRLTIIGSSYTNNQSTYTVQINSTGYATNAAFEINPNVNMALTVERRTATGTTTLKHSVAAGNQLEAGKYYQVTAVGNCWTLAEFTA